MMDLFALKESIQGEGYSHLCFGCGKEGGQDCGYGERDYYNDFSCTHENAENLECPCHETFCLVCKEK